MAKIYEHKYLPLSVYGNVVSLLRDNMSGSGVHLDIGCGYGAIAEPIRDELGLTYIGFDLAEDGLDSLKKRGFATFRIDLAEPRSAEETIRAATVGQTISSVTLIDTLEHLANGADILAMLRRIAESDNAPLVVSVPNVSHKDISLKLLAGRWDITEAGLLDHTHLAFYTHSRLARVMDAVGWCEIGEKDWLLETSDQKFPANMPTLNPQTPVGHFLRTLMDGSNSHAIVNQFVRVFRIAEPKDEALVDDRVETKRPFLSVLIATDGTKTKQLLRWLRELELQINQDFQLSIVLYSHDEKSRTIDNIVSNLSFSERVAIIRCNSATRTEALNAGLSRIRGRYVVIAHQTDGLRPNWISTFFESAAKNELAVLRVGRAGSNTEEISSDAIFPLPLDIPKSMSEFAIPGGVIRELGLKLDPGITYGSEWALVIHAVLLSGLAESPTIAISGNEEPAEGCTPQQVEIAAKGRHEILTRLNSHPLLLPPGSAEKLHRMSAKNQALERAYNETVGELRRRAAFQTTIEKYPLLREFVKSSLPDIQSANSQTHDTADDDSAFLTIIVRTRGIQGLRMRTLRETLMTLAGQSCQHFQLLLVVHSESTEAHQTIVRLVDEFPSDFTKRTTIFTCGRPGRAAPLNEALPHALGEYVAVLDDDDFVFGHWVETFKNLARESPGKLLRATSTRQNIDSLSGDRTRAASWFLMDWPGTYDALSHLIANSTPFMSVAFPRGLFHDLGWRFDEELSTIEDWQLTTRAAMVCGVASTPEVTSIYRWWNKHGSSLFEHPEEEWRKNYNRVIDMLDERPILLPAGTVRRIDGLLQQNNLLLASRDEFAARTAHLEQALSELQNQMIGHGPPLPAVELNSAAYPETRQILLDHINSTSWRLTRPFRWLSNMLRRRPGSGAALDRLPMSADQCAMLVHEIQTSTSWHLSRPVRYIGRMIKQGRHKNGRLH